MRWWLLSSTRCMAPDDGGAGANPLPADPAVAPATADPAAPAEPDPAPADPAAPAAEPEPEPKKPNGAERRFANLTRKLGDEARAREAAERRAQAAEALLREGRPEGAQPAPRPADDIETRAAALVAERQFNARLSEIDTAGKTEFGASWEDHKNTMTALGASNNKAFLEALAEADNPAKLFAHFAEDTDALVDVLGKSPTAIAARIGKMDAKMSQPAAPKPLSAAPAPAPKVRGAATPAEPSPTDYPSNMSMKDWNKMMDAHLPPHLGGKRKAS